MSYVLYINKPNRKVRLHDEDCSRIRIGGDNTNGDNGEYRYYNSYEKAWKKMYKLEDKGYDYDNCSYCNAGE